jgi:hypothetical protein
LKVGYFPGGKRGSSLIGFFFIKEKCSGISGWKLMGNLYLHIEDIINEWSGAAVITAVYN